MKTKTCLAAAVVSAALSLTATAAGDRPNIIVMMVDDMGYAGPSIAHPDRAANMLERIKEWYAEMQKTATLQPGSLRSVSS